jgi:hypothetical protein
MRGMESTTECDGDVHNHANGVYSTAGTANQYICYFQRLASDTPL